MNYAIDRYAVGMETEVSAKEFENVFIPGRRNRFFCPECGELVFFRNRGGNQPSQFYHQEKTDKTPECDKRVDGRSELSLNQRIGLPVYLTCTLQKYYTLNIGFPSLGAETLEKAEKAGYKVEIIGGEHRRTVVVDRANFIDDEMTFIPVDFIPPRGHNYTITITGDGHVYGLQRRWSDYADGFEIAGALFTFNETGGKKIRRGDSISTNRYYYAVSRYRLSSLKGLYQEEVGQLKVGTEMYTIFKLEVTVSLDDQNAFSLINEYLHRTFGVWLLECLPEIIPIWPPAIQRESIIPVVQESPLHCFISSGSVHPSVYVYSDFGVFKKELEPKSNGVNVIEVNTSNRPILLSVDRKYVGREVSILSKQVDNSSFDHIIELRNSNTESIPFETADLRYIGKDFQIHTNSKFEMYVETKDKIYRRIDVRECNTDVSLQEKCIGLFVVVENAIIQHIVSRRVEEPLRVDINASKLVHAVHKGLMVSVPRWVDSILRSLKQNHEDRLYDIIVTAIKRGKISTEMLKQLRLIESSRAITTNKH